MTDNENSDDGSDGTSNGTSQRVDYKIGTGEQPSIAVVKAVADLTGKDICDIEPLYDTMDPDHLDGLFEKEGSGEKSLREVSLQFNGCEVTVTCDMVRARRSE